MLQTDAALADHTLKSLDPVIDSSKSCSRQIRSFHIDILDETLDGKNTFHATQMAAWQRGIISNKDEVQLKPISQRALVVPQILGELNHINVNPSKSEIVFNGPVEKEWFDVQSVGHTSPKAIDLAFFLRRHNLECKLSWTSFNQTLLSDDFERTAIGFMPMILAPAHDFDTLNTVVQICLAVSSHFGQSLTVLTVDQALFSRLMELKWSVPEYQRKLFSRLGGLHTSINFLKAIGDHMTGSGLSDIWLESNLLGEGSIQLVLAGKSYNKAMRAHKLTLQELWEILLTQLLSHAEQTDDECYREISSLMTSESEDNVHKLIDALQTEGFQNMMEDFILKKI